MVGEGRDVEFVEEGRHQIGVAVRRDEDHRTLLGEQRGLEDADGSPQHLLVGTIDVAHVEDSVAEIRSVGGHEVHLGIAIESEYSHDLGRLRC